MKYFNQLLFIGFLFSSICYSQITNNNELLLVKTARFIHSQQYAFDVIKLNFPEQKTAIEDVELGFDKNFGAAIETINTKTKNLLGNKYESFIENLNNELNEYSINDIKSRLQGPIESPVLEILLAYKYQNNPVDEFVSNYVNTYSVKSYSNSTKVNLSLKVPLSWKELDGDSYTMLKKFRNEFGTGNVSITLSTKKSPKVTLINNNLARISQYDQTNSKSGIHKRYIVEHLYLSEGKVLEIKCTINSTTDNDLDVEYLKFSPLYKSIVKSVHIIKESENDNSFYTATKRKL